jgi:two-component system, OmpR family, phosphate regulon response regulator PhoB
MSFHILVIEDEPDLVSILEFNLRQEGFIPRCAMTGKGGLELAHQSPRPDLVVLDLMLPDISGTEVCRTLKNDPATQHIPVLMCTARDSELDRVVGFELGADDYVVKPFSVRELILRIRAILKRAQSTSIESPLPQEDNLVFGILRLETAAHRAWIEEKEIQLTALEFKLIKTFMKRKGRVQSREQLLQDVWDYDVNVTTRTVDTHVRRLRDKLGTEAGDYVETVRGVGYRMRETP